MAERSTYTWTDDDSGLAAAYFHDERGRRIGQVIQIGGSWAGYLEGASDVMFFRPDKESAQVALVKLVAEIAWGAD